MADQKYEAYKESQRKRAEARSRSGRNIGDMPEVQNPKRKAACERNFRLFCESYFAQTFALGWSRDHLKAIEKIESAVLRGGLFALAMPRGSGKTTLAEVAWLLGSLSGHHKFCGVDCERGETGAGTVGVGSD
jgi:ABC-type glutathione transport system ATPase component